MIAVSVPNEGQSDESRITSGGALQRIDLVRRRVFEQAARGG
jgi:hypothetical protein